MNVLPALNNIDISEDYVIFYKNILSFLIPFFLFQAIYFAVFLCDFSYVLILTRFLISYLTLRHFTPVLIPYEIQ